MWQTFSGEIQHIHTSKLQIGNPWQSKIQIPPKSSLLTQWVLVGLLTGIWVRSYLQEQKWLKDSCVTKATSGDGSQSWEPGAHWIACRQLSRLENVLSSCLIGLSLLQTALLVSAPKKLVWSQSLPCSLPESLLSSAELFWERISAFITYSGREGHSEFCPFQGLPEAFLSCLSPCLKSFPARWNVSILVEIVT